MFPNSHRKCQIENILRVKSLAFLHVDEPTDDEDREFLGPVNDTMDELRNYFEDLEHELRQIDENKRTLEHNFFELTELKSVLKNAESLLDKVRKHKRPTHNFFLKFQNFSTECVCPRR